MITDDQLYQLAIFLGSCAMLLIVLYHYLEVNAKDLPAAITSNTPDSNPSSTSTTSSKTTTPSSSSVKQGAAGTGGPAAAAGGSAGRKV
ncbi:hypothetical protein AJ79_03006 [Helicocarpus griseus UAMH5409]|uniref:Dolichyl-diphosphooligosaccharide--protein glycosyltransferase subunit 4 n=1 Tax=Helicocarpus griseus UAMH5409 TaxID=1447875 RepID=A0A2B7Y0F2_9EURO|nr:hypothetical protein AJ79_03006 [Helicocarpus griseus UAMH5409]